MAPAFVLHLSLLLLNLLSCRSQSHMGNSDTIFHKSSVLAKKYDGAGPGYVPIQITPQEHNSLTRFFKFPEGVKGTTVGDALKVLNFPRRLLDKPYLQLTAFDVNDCSKLGFLIKTLSRIKNKECNLDVAVVCSTRQTETLLVNVLNLYNFQFKPLSRCFDKEPPVVGALVRFRKSSTSDRAPNFKLSVDYIIAYDAACIIDREFSVYFKGVYYSKPQVVSLACERTSDLRICNYRDNNGKVVNGTTSLQEPDFSTMAMFCNAVYPKIKVADRQKANEDMSNDLVAWMLSKENRDFHPSRPDYLPPPSAKRRASEMTDAAPSNPPPPKKLAGAYKGPNYNAHHVSQQRLNVLKSRVQTSFPLKGLKFPSLILHDAILKGVDWLSGRRLINTRKNTIPGGDVGSTSRLGNVGPSSHTPSAQPSSSHGGMPGYSPAIASSSRPPPVAPSIHPSRLAMIEASQQPPLSLPFSTQYTQLQVPYPPEASNSNNNTDTLINNEDESMQAGLEGTVDSDMTPQDTSQESAEDRISLSNPNDTIENSPMEMDHVESDKSHEDSPQIEQESSNNGFNEFEEALERAHLELMRSLLGKGDEE